MREIQATDAKARLSELLHDVEQGETVVITRHGRAIARIVPAADLRQAEIAQAVAEIRRMRAHTGTMNREEILSARHEGHARRWLSYSVPR